MEPVVQLQFSPLLGHHRAVSDTHRYNPHATVSFPSTLKSQNSSLIIMNQRHFEHNFKKTLQVSFGVGRRGGGGGGHGNWGHDVNFEDFSYLQGINLVEFLIQIVCPAFTFRSSVVRLNDDNFILSTLIGLGRGGGSGCRGGDDGLGNGNGGGNGDESHDGNFEDSSSFSGMEFLGLFLNRWRSKVAADKKYSFIVMMENLVCVSVGVLRNMASRPNFAVNVLGIICLTLAAGLIILNLSMVYLLAPIFRSSWCSVPAIFTNYPKSHKFEPGAYGIRERLRFVKYKGSPFASTGFAVGLAATGFAVGLTALLNGFIKPEILKWIEDGLGSFCNLCLWLFAFIFCYF